MNVTQKFEELIKANDRPPVFFDLTSVDSNAFVLMTSWKTAAKKAQWTNEDIEIVLEECGADDYDHLVGTLLKVSTLEDEEDEDDDYIYDGPADGINPYNY